MNNSEVIDNLKRLLANSYTLYLQTHNFHWNVTGPMFTTLHTLFETQYTELAVAVDDVAERIRALGAKAPGTYHEFQSLAQVQETVGDPSAHEMIRILAEGQTIIAANAAELVRAAAQVGDEATAGLATDRMLVHEKNAWMLNAHLEA